MTCELISDRPGLSLMGEGHCSNNNYLPIGEIDLWPYRRITVALASEIWQGFCGGGKATIVARKRVLPNSRDVLQNGKF